jgi:hypothetical protein
MGSRETRPDPRPRPDPSTRRPTERPEKMTFTKWLDTMISEKGINLDRMFSVEGPSGPNHMTLAIVVEAIKGAAAHEQTGIKKMLIKLDFLNQPIAPYFEHLARAIAR